MKPVFKILLKYYLKCLAKLVILIHKPVIIAVSGSTNKTFAKNEIKKVLEEKGVNVWADSKSFNTEIGLPLAILRISSSGYNSYRNWLPVIVSSLIAICRKSYPEVIILELGVSRAGDMRYLLSIVKPKIAVVTDITQRYLESFSGMSCLVGEYKCLVKCVPEDGLVILNADNLRIKELEKMAKASTETFGEGKNASWMLADMQRNPIGDIIKIENGNNTNIIQLKSFGKHNAYAHIISFIISKNYDRFFSKN